MENFYRMKIAGLERDLPLCKVNENMDIAAFIMFNDVEITYACAKALLEKCPDFDVIITAEAKGIPLAYEMARQSGKNYIVARKGAKLYMKDPVFVSVRSITTDHMQTLFLDSSERELLCGKKVLIVDDVISTGESLEALVKLVTESGGNIAAKAAVLAEGDAAQRKDIHFLEPLHLFFK